MRFWWGLGLILVLGAGVCSASSLFPTAARREGFFKALAEQDKNYDPGQKMLRAKFSSPGYHTTLKNGYVHRTRESLKYAVALLDSGDPDRAVVAAEIIEQVISLQDTDSSSKTYGIWPWFLEEPLEEMSPPDWNWADFCGTQLLQVAIDHVDRLPMELRYKVRDSILHAAASIQKRNVGPSYTNIALMGTYVTLVAGERFNDKQLVDYGKQRLRRFMDYASKTGMFSEYNSPTYTIVAIEVLSLMKAHVRDTTCQDQIRELNGAAWYHLARHWHRPTKQWAGPHSRCYSTLLRPDALAFIQRGTGIKFVSEVQAYESIEAQRIPLSCDSDMYAYFKKGPKAHQEIETFVKTSHSEHDIIGTTYLHPDFTLGTVNLGDLWNQRRPLVAYWKGPSGVTAMRLRCLHDDYDYASASLFTVQDQGHLLTAVTFATDRGDTHISLDKIPNGTIEAKDLRIRLEFEGAISDLELPRKVDLDETVHFASGPIVGSFSCIAAVFDNNPISIETGRDNETAWVDIVLYKGPRQRIDFREIAEAAVVMALSITPAEDRPARIRPGVSMSIAYGVVPGTQKTASRKTWLWRRTNKSPMSLTIPLTPLPTKDQKRAAAAKYISSDPWKTSL